MIIRVVFAAITVNILLFNLALFFTFFLDLITPHYLVILDLCLPDKYHVSVSA